MRSISYEAKGARSGPPSGKMSLPWLRNSARWRSFLRSVVQLRCRRLIRVLLKRCFVAQWTACHRWARRNLGTLHISIRYEAKRSESSKLEKHRIVLPAACCIAQAAYLSATCGPFRGIVIQSARRGNKLPMHTLRTIAAPIETEVSGWALAQEKTPPRRGQSTRAKVSHAQTYIRAVRWSGARGGASCS